MNSNNNRKRKALENEYYYQKKPKCHGTVQEKEGTQKQKEEEQRYRILQEMAWRQRDDRNLEEYLKHHEHLTEYYEEMEPIEQKQVKELEEVERLETRQLDGDYQEQLKQIELVEHEDEQQQEQHYVEMQHQLEQLEQQEQMEAAQRICYYEWLERFQKDKKEVIQLKSFDLVGTLLQPLPYTSKHDIMEPSDDDNESDSCMIIETEHDVVQQRQEKINYPMIYGDKLFKMIEEYGSSLDIIVQTIDNEFNEDDWMFTYNEKTKQHQQQIDHIDVYHVDPALFPSGQRPVLHIARCNINSIRYQLKERLYLLLKAYNSNHFYLCHTNEMKQKVFDHMTQSHAYIVIQDLHQTNNRYVEHLLNTIMTRITKILDELFHRHFISAVQLQQMKMEPSRLRLDFLSFQPDTRYKEVPFRAHMTCCLGPTMALSRFLHHLLQPLYEQVTKSITFLEGIDCIDAVELYAKTGSLQPTTLFATFSIDNLSTVFSHEHSIQSLERFLNEYISNRQIQGITIETIIHLVTIYHQNQYFVHNNKVYQQIKGTGSNSHFGEILVNVDMFYRQQNLINTLFKKKEIFGRCFDEAFLTWNGSIEDLHHLLKTVAKDQHPQLQMRYSIGQKVSYLTATIAHQNGHIDNNVNHGTLLDPYSLIPLSNYPLHTILSTVQTALLHAITYCSTRASFKEEMDYLESMLTWHHLSPTFIMSNMEYKIRQLFYYVKHHADANEYSRNRYFARSSQEKEAMTIMKQQPLTEQETFYLNCPLQGQQLTEFKQDFERLLEHCYGKDFNLKKLNIDIVTRPNYLANTR